MYYLSPFTYMVEGMLVTGLARTNVVCSDIEFRIFDPPSNLTCFQYLQPYLQRTDGYLRENTTNATKDCAVCDSRRTDTVLAKLSGHYSNRWRDFGVIWIFIAFNVCAAIFLYWLARVPKKQKVLDVPPTEAASRVQSRVSRMQSKTTRSHEKATGSERKATNLEEKTTGSEEEITSSKETKI